MTFPHVILLGVDTETPTQTPIDSGQVFDTEIASAIANFDTQLKARYKPDMYRKLRTIGAFVANGTSVPEACILSLIDPDELTRLMDEDPAVKAFVVHKEITYKAKLIKTLSVSAFGGNVKAAGYLLEQKYREEFGRRSSKDPLTRAQDDIQQALEFIRENGDLNPIVKPQTLPTPKIYPSQAVYP